MPAGTRDIAAAITDTIIAKLEAGMTRSQVAFLLGTPMVPPAFDRDRWDYFYYLKDRSTGTPDTESERFV